MLSRCHAAEHAVAPDQTVVKRGPEIHEECRDGVPTPANAAPTLSITAAIAPSRTVTPTLVTRAALNQSGLLFPVDLQGLGVLRVRSIFSAGVVDICHLQSAVADYSEARTIEIDGSIVHKGLEGYTEVCGV